MKNAINFFYNLTPDNIYNYNNYYYFYYNNYLYTLFLYEYDIKSIDNTFELNTKMIRSGLRVHQIVLNKNMQALSLINNNYYILYKILINNFNKKINLLDISKLNTLMIDNRNDILHNDWSVLWASKIDYLEYQVNQTGKKYPIIVQSFSYFVGLTENAISYLRNTIHEIKPDSSDIGVISHKKILINDNLFNLYNPTNIIVDYKVRDLAEYIKNSFFQDNFKIIDELNIYFKTNYYSMFSIRILFARILYPSFYFNIYDDIIRGKVKEEAILKITSRINEYEQYLYEIFLYLKKFYNIPEIEWLKKRRFNLPH